MFIATGHNDAEFNSVWHYNWLENLSQGKRYLSAISDDCFLAADDRFFQLTDDILSPNHGFMDVERREL